MRKRLKVQPNTCLYAPVAGDDEFLFLAAVAGNPAIKTETCASNVGVTNKRRF